MELGHVRGLAFLALNALERLLQQPLALARFLVALVGLHDLLADGDISRSER